MIENRRAVENIEEILSVPELGFVFVGPADLTISYSGGDPSEKSEEEVQAAIERTREAALDADVPIGRIQNDPEKAREAVEKGYQIVRIGGDTGAIRQTLGSRLDAATDR
jgi:2-dehydro-3-deoxyglucarate aldolase